MGVPQNGHRTYYGKREEKMIGQTLFYNKLMEVSPEYIVNILMNSKKAFDVAGASRGAKLMHKAAILAAKRKGVKAGAQSSVDALVHATRHPKVKKLVDLINMTEPHYQGLPLHPGRWQ